MGIRTNLVVVAAGAALAAACAKGQPPQLRADETAQPVTFVGCVEQGDTPDEFVVRGTEIYLLLPNGVARSKLTNAYFDSKLATTSTSRNWRTVLKLFQMMMG